jgi:phosphatidylglycerophosphate synthase
MLDPYIRVLINPPLLIAGKRLAERGISANILTFAGLIAGLLAMVAIFNHEYTTAALLIVINRVLDGLDGAVARFTHTSDFGGILDIACDFIVYSGVVFVFGLSEPDYLIYALFLIFSFIGPITTFLAYAIIAAKRGITTSKRGIKSFYHLGGICEGTETSILLLLICIMPASFPWASIIFGIMCWLTTFGRLYQSYVDFEDDTTYQPASAHERVNDNLNELRKER